MSTVTISPDLIAAINTVPTVALHVHLEATITNALIQKLEVRHGIKQLEVARDSSGNYIFSDLMQFVHHYDACAGILRAPEDWTELMYNYLKMEAEAGCIYAEVIMSPFFATVLGDKILDPMDFDGMEAHYPLMLDSLANGIDKARADFGIECRMLSSIIRHLGADHGHKLTDITLKYPHPYVTGFLIAGAETMYEFKDFARDFARAHEAGLGIMVHAGEACDWTSVRAALDTVAGLARIGHGVRAIEDAALLAEIRERDIILEVCPTSNLLLNIYPSYEAHPLRKLLDAGLKVCLNTDDPYFFGVPVTRDEYRNAAVHMGITVPELRQMAKWAMEKAFVDETVRKDRLAKL